MPAAPNERLANAAHKLGNIIAPQMTTAVEVIAHRLANLDGIPSGGERNGSSSDVSNPTERIALKRHQLATTREDLRDAITDCVNTIDCLGRMVDDAIRSAGHIPEHSEQPLCRDGQQGKEGAVEWGDPMCCRLPVKGSMCLGHYWKWYRHRQAKDIDTRKDFVA